MTPSAAEVEHVTDADSRGRLDAREHAHAVGRPREELTNERFLASRAVLQVDQQPVEATERTDLRRKRRAEVEKRAPRRRTARAHAPTASSRWLTLRRERPRRT